MGKRFLSKAVKRTIALALAVTLVMGSSITSLAVKQNPNDNGYEGIFKDVEDVGADNFDGNLQTAINPAITVSVNAAENAAEQAKTAADQAAAALLTAQEAQKEAEAAVNNIEAAVAQASVSANEAQQIAGENSNYTYVVSGNEVSYVKNDSVTSPDATTGATVSGSWVDVKNLENVANQIQGDRDNFEQNLEDQMASGASQIDGFVAVANEAAVSANQAAVSANSAAVKAASATTVAEATAAQKEVKVAAENAKKAAEEADQAYQDALALYNQAEAIYQSYVINDAEANIGEDAAIERLKDAVSDNSISSNEAAFNQAKADYEAALLAAGEAATAASNASISANIASDLAAQYADDATTNADGAINFYVDPAQAKLATISGNIASVEEQINGTNGLAQKMTAADTAYKNKVPTVTAAATSTYNQTRTNLQNEMIAAENRYKNLSKSDRKWQKFWNSGEYKKWKQAEDNFDAYDKPSVEKKLIESALTSQPEYKALTDATTALNNANKTLSAYEKEQAAQAKVVAEAEAVRASYLKEITAANEAEQKQDIIDALRLKIGKSVEGINQTEYDEALSEYANDAWLAVKDYNDTKAIRAYLNDKYKASKWGKVFDVLAITQWSTDPDKLIEQVEATYRITLKQQEEKLATVNAYIAKTDATGAAASADIAAKAADAAADAAAATEKLNTAKDTLAKANEVFAKAQASLAAAKAAADKVQLTYVDFTTAAATLEGAKRAVALAEAAKLAAAEAAKLAADAKAICDARVIELSKVVTKTDTTGTTDDTDTPSPAVAKTVSANLVTIVAQPVAQAAAPVTVPARTRRAAANTTVIEDEETPQAATVEVADEVEDEEEVIAEKETTVIEDEAAPLAAEMETNAFSWLWLLLLIPIAAAAYMGYRYYAKRKALK